MTGREVPAYDRLVVAPRASDLAVVVPVLNEGDRIRDQLRRMAAVAHGMDVIVADGGSTDGALDPELLGEVGVRALLTKRGPGKLSAQLRMAFDWVLDEGYDGVVTVDGNGKDGVDALPAFAASLRDGFDFVQGSRFVAGGRAVNTPPARYWAIRLVHAPIISAGARHWFTDTTNGFRGHSRRLLADPRVGVFRGVFDRYELLAYLPVCAARLGYRVCEIPVERSYPEGDVPTKIHSVSAHGDLLAVCVRAARGAYAPPRTLP